MIITLTRRAAQVELNREKGASVEVDGVYHEVNGATLEDVEMKFKNFKIYHKGGYWQVAKIGVFDYQFPRLTSRELRSIKDHNLKVLCAMPNGDVVVRGKIEDLERFADLVLHYDLIDAVYVGGMGYCKIQYLPDTMKPEKESSK